MPWACSPTLHLLSTLTQVHLPPLTALLFAQPFYSPTTRNGTGTVKELSIFLKENVCFLFLNNNLGFDLRNIFGVRGNCTTGGCQQIYYIKPMKKALSLGSEISFGLLFFYCDRYRGRLARYDKFGKTGVSKYATEVR